MARTDGDEKEYLPNRQRPEAESRLLALMLMDGLPDAADTFLLRCCAEADLLTYFELMPALSRLTREGQALRRQSGTVWRYRLTDAGRETLALFAGRIPASDRDRIARLLPAWREALRIKQEYRADMRQTARGEYEVTLAVMDGETPVLSLCLPVPSAELAARVRDRWETAGARVYAGVMDLLTQTDETAQTEEAKRP